MTASSTALVSKLSASFCACSHTPMFSNNLLLIEVGWALTVLTNAFYSMFYKFYLLVLFLP